MNWQYKSKNFTETPPNIHGFIYCITYTNGKKYIGMKAFYSYNTLPALKTGILRPNATRIMKRRPLTKPQLAERTAVQLRTNVTTTLLPFDIVKKEARWHTYKGSSKATVNLEIAHKEILCLVPTKRNMTYMEAKALFANDVLESNVYVNDNILGKFFKDKLN